MIFSIFELFRNFWSPVEAIQTTNAKVEEKGMKKELGRKSVKMDRRKVSFRDVYAVVTVIEVETSISSSRTRHILSKSNEANREEERSREISTW